MGDLLIAQHGPGTTRSPRFCIHGTYICLACLTMAGHWTRGMRGRQSGE